MFGGPPQTAQTHTFHGFRVFFIENPLAGFFPFFLISLAWYYPVHHALSFLLAKASADWPGSNRTNANANLQQQHK